MITNEYGRPWEGLDALRMHLEMQARKEPAYAVLSEDGAPLCGKHHPQIPSRVFIAENWSRLGSPKRT